MIHRLTRTYPSLNNRMSTVERVRIVQCKTTGPWVESGVRSVDRVTGVVAGFKVKFESGWTSAR